MVGGSFSEGGAWVCVCVCLSLTRAVLAEGQFQKRRGLLQERDGKSHFFAGVSQNLDLQGETALRLFLARLLRNRRASSSTDSTPR